ncbi:hypothetical protein HPB52_016359 [Rhipicephalus sanguineus]|uniref:Uncharacterized protein n=1 Tax=Rhipicephalus sanguineus TaxID=34632 RepID=A0A9D4PJT6_RHISA|nr:hypothetical protein HPB52_016359 [Rhipicephalus sanguineus]
MIYAAANPAESGDATIACPVIAAELLPSCFRPENIRGRFAEGDAPSQLRRITSLTPRHLNVEAALPFEIANAFDDLLAGAPSAIAYEVLNHTLL